MFKKLRKKRFSFKSKHKSTSLRDINVVGNFVRHTAQIMSASAESLDSIERNSISLLSILDQVFKPSTKRSTAPTSLVSSSKRTSLFNSHSNRSESTNNSSPKTELLPNDHYENVEDPINEPSPEIEMITEENASISEMITSFYASPTENVIPSIPNSPLQRQIVKPPLKKCYSFNDLNIRRIITLNKKSDSIQTFTSTEATLSVEIIKFEDPGNYKSTVKLSTKHRLISREQYKNNTLTRARLKKIVLKHNCQTCNSHNINNLLFNELKKSIDISNVSSIYKSAEKLILINNYKNSMGLNLLNIKSYVNLFNNYARNIDDTIFGNYVINDDLPSNHCRDEDTITFETNDQSQNRKMLSKTFHSYHGDEKSEISEICNKEEKLEPACVAEDNCLDTLTYRTKLGAFITNPIVVTTLVIGGLLILVPTCRKLSQWWSSSLPVSLTIEPPSQITTPTLSPIRFIAKSGPFRNVSKNALRNGFYQLIVPTKTRVP